MKRSWAYIVNGYRMKLSTGTPDEKIAAKRLAEEFFASPPQFLPIVEAKDNPTSTTIEVCKIVQTASSMHLIKSGAPQPKLLQVAGEWLLSNGYESKTLRALITVLNCLVTLEQCGSCNSCDYTEGRIAVLRSSFQQLLQLATIDKESGSLGVLLVAASAANASLKKMSETVAQEDFVCASDEEFFSEFRNGRFSLHYYSNVLEPFLCSQLPSAVVTCMIQHRDVWLALDDGLSTLSGVLVHLPPSCLPLAWGAVSETLGVRVSKGSVSGASSLAILEAIVVSQSAEYPNSTLASLGVLVEGVMRWVTRTAASEFGGLRDLRRLFHALSQLYSAKGLLQRQLDVKELHRLMEVLRPKILQLVSGANVHASEISMIAGALGRCQHAIVSHRTATSQLMAIVHIDVFRALISSMASAKNVQLPSIVPFLSALSQMLVRESKNPKTQKALLTLMVPRVLASGKRTPQPPIMKVLQMTRDAVDDKTTPEQLSTILLHTLRLQLLVAQGSPELGYPLLDAIRPVIVRLEKETLSSNLLQLVQQTLAPQLAGLRQTADANIGANQSLSSSIPDLHARVDGFQGSLAEASSLIKLAGGIFSELDRHCEDERAVSLGIRLLPILKEFASKWSQADLCAAFTTVSFVRKDARDVSELLLSRAISIVSDPGSYQGKAKLLQSIQMEDLGAHKEKASFLLMALAKSVSLSLLSDEQQSGVDSPPQAIQRIVSLLPSLSSLALAGTKFQALMAHLEEDSDDLLSSKETSPVIPLLDAIAGRLDILFGLALESEELTPDFIETCGKGLPPLIAALQAGPLRHKLHFTLLPDLNTLVGAANPSTLLSVLRGFSKVGVWNNRALAPLCQSIERSICEGDDAAMSLRSTAQLLFNMVRSGLVTDVQGGEEPVGRLVSIATEQLGRMLSDDSVPIGDRQSTAMLALQPLSHLTMFPSAESVASRLVWDALNRVDVPEVFTALAFSMRLGGPTNGFTSIVRAMAAKSMMKALQPRTIEIVARCLLFAIREGEMPSEEVREIVGDLCRSAHNFSTSGTVAQYASFLVSLSSMSHHADRASVDSVLEWGWRRFAETRLSPQIYASMAVSVGRLGGSAAVNWRDHLRAEQQWARGDVLAASLFLYSPDEEFDFEGRCQEIVARRKTLSPMGSVWVLSALTNISAAPVPQRMVVRELAFAARAAVAASQLIISTPYADALEGSFSAPGSGVCPPDSLLGAYEEFSIPAQGVERLVGDQLGKALERRILELQKRAKSL